MSIYDQFPTNMSLVRPQDAMGLVGAALPQDLKTSATNLLGGSFGSQLKDVFQNPYSAEGIANINKNAAEQAASKQEAPGMSEMDMYRMAAGALQGLGKNQQAMPSGNTAQIINDKNQFRFAGFQQSPQQQMAQALRNRG